MARPVRPHLLITSNIEKMLLATPAEYAASEASDLTSHHVIGTPG